MLDAFPDKEWLVWNEYKGTLENISTNSGLKDMATPVVFGYFDSEGAEKLNEWMGQMPNQSANNEEMLTLQVAAIDINENDRLDQLEGLNLLFNSLDRSISVKNLKESISAKYPELEIAPVLYSFSQGQTGELHIKPMADEDSILALAPFWMMLEAVQEPTTLVISEDELTRTLDTHLTEEQAELTLFKLNFSLKGTEREKTLMVTFSDFDQYKVPAIKDLGAYPQLQLQNQSNFQAAFASMDEYYKSLSFPEGLNSKISIPVYFNMSGSGQVQVAVSEWENIPPEWELKLEDKISGNQYDLRESFVLNFDHNGEDREEVNTATGEENVAEEASENRTESRFVVYVIPPGTESKETEELETPRELELHQNFPNPFNPETTISFYLPESEEVKLSVFNIVGQPIAVLVNGTLSAGEKHYEWDASDRPSGMYIYQLEVGNRVMTRKMTLVK